MAALTSDNYDADMDDARGEFIFLLDRSGSMSGKRMEMAREALVLFLKSLPAQCYFNIVSFGSSYESMFDESKLAIDEIIEEAVDKVSNFSANMGGT